MGFDVGNAVLALAFIAVLVWALVREGQHQRIIRDLTAKILAKDLNDYKQVAEDLPPKPKEEKKKIQRHSDPVLGSDY